MRIARLILVCFLCSRCLCIPPALAQQASTGTAFTSDPAARQVLEQALTALGGRAAWQSIHTAKAHAVVFDSSDGKSHDFYMLDDWATDEVKYRRGVKGQSPPSTHSGGQPWQVTERGKAATVPEYDQASVLVGYLPGAAALVILKKSEYIVKSSPASICPAANSCVDVYRQPVPNGPTLKIQSWVIPKSTGLPSTIMYRLHGTRISLRDMWENVQYTAYVPSGAVMTPSTTSVRAPAGKTLKIVYDPISLNPNYNATLFDQEVAQ